MLLECHNILHTQSHILAGVNTSNYTALGMDPFYLAISLYRRRNYNACIDKCNELLLGSQGIQPGPWELKMRAMTQRVYVDDIEANDENIGTDCCPYSIDKPISGVFFVSELNHY